TSSAGSAGSFRRWWSTRCGLYRICCSRLRSSDGHSATLRATRDAACPARYVARRTARPMRVCTLRWGGRARVKWGEGADRAQHDEVTYPESVLGSSPGGGSSQLSKGVLKWLSTV